MKVRYVLALGLSLSVSGFAAAGDNFKLPPEVTPQLRAACESDVRRLCIGSKPTVAKVKRCVARKFMKLGRRCQFALASAGFKR
jgi:hypothetical protein